MHVENKLMNELISTIKEQEKEFEAEFMTYAEENENTLLDADIDGNRVKAFIRNSIISILEEQVRGMAARKDNPVKFIGTGGGRPFPDEMDAYNAALDEQISDLKETIKQLKDEKVR